MENELATFQARIDDSNYISLNCGKNSVSVDKLVNGEKERIFACASKSDLSNVLQYRGVFSGDFNRTDIDPGFYEVHTYTSYTNGPPDQPAYFTFFQSKAFHIQVIFEENKIFLRRYVGKTPAWTEWNKFLATS